MGTLDMNGNRFLAFDFLTSDSAKTAMLRLIKISQALCENSARNDIERRFPVENFELLHHDGLLALQMPRAYGGTGLAFVDYAAWIGMLGTYDGATALAYNMHSSAIVSMNTLASEEQKRRWFPKVVETGARIAALGSEPRLKPLVNGALPCTQLVRCEGGYHLSGTKSYCSFGRHADLLYVSANLDEKVAFAIVDANAPGITRDDNWNVFAMRSTASITTIFQDVFIPEEDIVTSPDQGLAFLLEMEFALGYGPIYLGIAAGACEKAAQILCQKITVTSGLDSGGPSELGDAFGIVGKMFALLEPAWLVCQKAAQTDQVGSFRRAVAIASAKAVACDAACDAATMALRLAGGQALQEEDLIGRAFRDVQAGQVMAFSPAFVRTLRGSLALGRPPAFLEKLMKRP